jgi:hypothetical protein
MATTTSRDDYLGRDLVTPASASKDFLGRATTSSVDYLGRGLTRVVRANSTAYSLGAFIEFTGGQEFTVTTAGTSGESQPTAPAIGATVNDGTAVLTRTS